MSSLNGSKRVRVDSWKVNGSAPQPSRVTAMGSLPATFSIPVNGRTPAGNSADPFAVDEPNNIVDLRIAAGRVPDLEDRARRAENRETRTLAVVDRERRERRALIVVAVLLGLALTGWRLNNADQLVAKAQGEAQRISLERDQARTHVAGLTAESHVLRESLRDERDRAARLQVELEDVAIELERGERVARAFGESIAKLVRGK